MTTPHDKLKAYLDEWEAKRAATHDGRWSYEYERYSARCVIGLKPNDDRWICHFHPEFLGEQSALFVVHAANESDKLVSICREFLEALTKISDVTSAIDESRKISFADWELRNIARETLEKIK